MKIRVVNKRRYIRLFSGLLETVKSPESIDFIDDANVAQLVEQLTRNERKSIKTLCLLGFSWI